MTAELFDAIKQQDVERVAKLLTQEIDLNAILSDHPYWSPLQAAIEEITWYDSSLEIVRLLIQHGADVNVWYMKNQSTPLHSAMGLLYADMQIYNNALVQKELIQLLLEAGADPNAFSDEGESALKWAVEEGDLVFAKLFLRFGANKTINKIGGFCGSTPLTRATRDLDLKMIELLVFAGADLQAMDEDRRTAYSILEKEKFSQAQWKVVNRLLNPDNPPYLKLDDKEEDKYIICLKKNDDSYLLGDVGKHDDKKFLYHNFEIALFLYWSAKNNMLIDNAQEIVLQYTKKLTRLSHDQLLELMRNTIGETLSSDYYLDEHKDFPIAYLPVTNWAYDFYSDLKKLHPSVDYLSEENQSEEFYQHILMLLDKRYEQFSSGNTFNANQSSEELLALLKIT